MSLIDQIKTSPALEEKAIALANAYKIYAGEKMLAQNLKERTPSYVDEVYNEKRLKDARKSFLDEAYSLNPEFREKPSVEKYCANHDVTEIGYKKLLSDYVVKIAQDKGNISFYGETPNLLPQGRSVAA